MSFCLTSTKCSAFGHAELRIHGDSPALSDDAAWLIDYFETSVANGEHFKPGETIQIGWMINRVDHDGADLLTLSEPDFRSCPITFRRSVTSTLHHLRIQKDTVDSLGLLEVLSFPSIRHAALLTGNFSTSSQLRMWRNEPMGADSGWVVETDHSEGHQTESKLISIYELAISCPDIIPYMALPTGIEIIAAESSKPEFRFHNNLLPFAPESFLSRYLARRR